MLKSIEGIYHNGQIKLKEIPKNIPPKTKVIVTFLETSEQNISNYPPYHDLDYLAGNWSQEDENEFIANTQEFRKIDQNLWQ